MSAPLPAYASASEIAAEYGRTSRHWIRMATEGKIPGAYQPGGAGCHWAFDRAAFRRWAIETGYIVDDEPVVAPLVRVRKPKRADTPTDHLYVAYSAGLVKVGISNDYRVRSRSFKTASPVPIHIILAIPGTFAAETVLHARFGACHSHGEWFRLTPEVRAFVDEHGAGAILAHAERDFQRWLREHGHVT